MERSERPITRIDARSGKRHAPLQFPAILAAGADSIAIRAALREENAKTAGMVLAYACY
jgi:hypothetical protein